MVEARKPSNRSTDHVDYCEQLLRDWTMEDLNPPPLLTGHDLARMGLEQTASSLVVDLPFGQQKLIGLARTLMNDGELLLLDEPMAGVEGAAYETMQRVVRQEAEAGRAVCVVEHNVSFIRDLCSRAVFMAQGKILQDGTVEELISSSVLTELYFGV